MATASAARTAPCGHPVVALGVAGGGASAVVQQQLEGTVWPSARASERRAPLPVEGFDHAGGGVAIARGGGCRRPL